MTPRVGTSNKNIYRRIITLDKHTPSLLKSNWRKIVGGGVALAFMISTVTLASMYTKSSAEIEATKAMYEQKIEQANEANSVALAKNEETTNSVRQELVVLKEEMSKKDETISGLNKQISYTKKAFQAELMTAESKLSSVKNKLDNTRTELGAAQSKIQNTVKTTSSTLPSTTSNKIKSTSASSKKTILVKQQVGAIFTVEATAYTAKCTGCSGITAAGVDIRKTTPKIIAVDPNVIDLNRKVELFVDGKSLGIWETKDVGGDIKGFRIDVLKATMSEALQFGRQYVTLKVVE